MILINIEFMRNYIKLTKYQSFSKLAEDLSMSQSTLSHQISQLEDILKVKLIDRTTRKFSLSDAGKILLTHAEKIIDIYDSCVLELKKFNEQEDISITASTFPGSHLLPKHIALFRLKNPNVNFKIIINNSQKSLNLLNRNMADFAGIGSFMNQQSDDYDYIKIGEDKLVFICNPNHEILKSDKKTINLEDFSQYPFIAREQGSGTRKIMETHFSAFNDLNIKLEMNDNDSIISAISGSNYISILSELIASKAENAGLIKIIRNIKDLPTIATREIYFIKLKKVELSKLKLAFWDYLKEKV